MSSTRLPLLLVITLCYSSLVAQQDTPSASPGDSAWSALTAVRASGESVEVQKAGESDPIAKKAGLGEGLLLRATEFREFRTKYPSHEKAKEAKLQEAVALFQAGFQGDITQESLRAQLVAELRADRSISVSKRSSVAAYAENLKIARRRDLTPAARLTEAERVVRSLITEFPEVADGYESLLGIAFSRSDEYAAQVAGEVLQSNVPETIKRQARIMIYRQSLVGRPAVEIAAQMPELKAHLEQLRGQNVFLYTWTYQSPPVMAFVRKLSADSPANVALIGLSLDEDSSAAASAANDAAIRGRQCYKASDTAARLTMQSPGWMFSIDEKGIVTSVSAQRSPVQMGGRAAK